MIYISSAKESEYNKAEIWLKLKNEIPINPMNIIQTLPKLSEKILIKIRFALIEMCDGILMANGWKDNEISKLELIYAKSLGKKIYYQKYYKEFRNKGENEND